MKPAPFDYVKPTSVAEAMELLARHGDMASVLAGGQSLMPTLNMRLSAPDCLVDINGLDELAGISEQNGRVRIGALTRHSEIETSPIVATHLPMIATAVSHVAHPAIRNRGTMGGSLALADPAAEYPACVVALDAEIEIIGTAGARKVAARDYFKGLYETELGEGELLAAIEFPARGANDRYAFLELARRHGDYALAGIAAWANMDGTRVDAARLVFFGVGGIPVLAAGANAVLVGNSIDETVIEAVQTALDADLDPFDDVNSSGAYKLHISKELAARVLRQLTEEWGAGQ